MIAEYLAAIVNTLHKVVTKVSHEGERLIMSNIVVSSSSIFVPYTAIWELKLLYSFRCAWIESESFI